MGQMFTPGQQKAEKDWAGVKEPTEITGTPAQLLGQGEGEARIERTAQ